jgi:hypothetical protein
VRSKDTNQNEKNVQLVSGINRLLPKAPLAYALEEMKYTKFLPG